MCVCVEAHLVSTIFPGLLPTPNTAPVPTDNRQSTQGSPLSHQPSKATSVPLSSPPPQHRSRPIPKSYKMSPQSSPTSPPATNSNKRALYVPGQRATRSVSPLVTHARSAREQTPPTEAHSPLSDDSGSDSGTPSPLHHPHTYTAAISPIVYSEEGSDSAAPRSPSPLSLVRRENGLQV